MNIGNCRTFCRPHSFEEINSERVFLHNISYEIVFEFMYIYNCIPFRSDGTPCTLNPSRVRSKGHRPAFPSTCFFRQGFSGWAFEAVISKARSQFAPSRGKNKLTWFLVIWRHKSGPQQQLDGTIEDAFKNAKLPVPPGPSPLWESGGAWGESQENGLMSAAS